MPNDRKSRPARKSPTAASPPTSRSTRATAKAKSRGVGPIVVRPTPVEHPKVAAAKRVGGVIVHAVEAGEHTGVPGGAIVVAARPTSPPKAKATKPKAKATRKATPRARPKRGD